VGVGVGECGCGCGCGRGRGCGCGCVHMWVWWWACACARKHVQGQVQAEPPLQYAHIILHHLCTWSWAGHNPCTHTNPIPNPYLRHPPASPAQSEQEAQQRRQQHERQEMEAGRRPIGDEDGMGLPVTWGAYTTGGLSSRWVYMYGGIDGREGIRRA